MSSDPLEKLRKLCERIQEKAKELNLDAGQISLIPGSPDQLVVTFIISEQAVEDETQAEKRKLDEQFESIMGANFKKSTEFNQIDSKTKDKLDEMDETLRKWMNGE